MRTRTLLGAAIISGAAAAVLLRRRAPEPEPAPAPAPTEAAVPEPAPPAPAPSARRVPIAADPEPFSMPDTEPEPAAERPPSPAEVADEELRRPTWLKGVDEGHRTPPPVAADVPAPSADESPYEPLPEPPHLERGGAREENPAPYDPPGPAIP